MFYFLFFKHWIKLEFQPNVAIRSLLMKLDEENENFKPLFVIVNAGLNFNIMEEVSRIVVNSLDRTVQILHSVNKVNIKNS